MAKEKNTKIQPKNKKGIRYQIQSKIGISVCAVMALVIILVVVVVYSLLTKANDTELQQDSEAAALEVEMYFAPFERMVEQQAINTDVKSIINSTKAGQDITANIKYLTVLNNMISTQELDEENILATWIGDIDANVLTQSDKFTSGADFDITTRAWYACTKTGKTMLTEPYIDASTGQKILSAATPVLDAMGNAVGVSGMDISIEDIMALMKNYTIGEEGYVMLVSQSGTFIYHPNAELIDTLIQDMDITDNVIKAVESQKAQMLKYTANGEKKYGYITPVGETGFMAISCIPSGQYYSSLITSISMLVVVFMAGLVFIILTMGKAAGNIVKPLLELNDTAMQLAEGNLDVTINAQTEDEVGDLGRSIDKTVTRLKEYIDYIDEISEVLAAMADGKLAIHLKYAYVGEFEKVKDALNHISKAMTDVMTNITESANQVSVGSDDLARAAQGMAEGSEAQAAAV